MQVNIIKGGFLPTRATSEAAGYDLFAPVNGRVKSKDRLVVDLKFRLYLKPGTYGQIYGRSGHALRHGLAVLGGVIDSDYRGEVKVILHNTGSEHFDFKRGDRIAQLVIHQIVLDTPKVTTLFPDEEDTSVYIPKLLQDDPEDSGAVYSTAGLAVKESAAVVEPPPAEFPDSALSMPEVPETPAPTPELASVLSPDLVESMLSALDETTDNVAADLSQHPEITEPEPQQPSSSADAVADVAVVEPPAPEPASLEHSSESAVESAVKKPRAPAKKRGKAGFGSTGV